jgi:putative DNA primase/helicase
MTAQPKQGQVQGGNQPAISLPKINAEIQNLPVITKLAWDALRNANQPPYLFRRAGSIYRIERDEKKGLILRWLSPDRARYELARAAQWVKTKTVGQQTVEADAKPPMDVVKDLLATPNPPLPILNRITQVPVFAANGKLQTTVGYHPAAKIYYSPAAGLIVPAVPMSPTAQDVENARNLIVNELFCDFPFLRDADRAHAVALFLLPFARDLIDGATPMHLIEAPTAGSGKGLLADVALRPAVGQHIGILTQAHDGDEWRKRLTSLFKEMREVILIDNVTTTLDSGELAAALTALVWEDRILGRNETASFPVRCAWVCTANNPTMSTEIARRCARSRLDSGIDRPWVNRTDFKHADLRSWADEHRSELVWSALVLIQAWLAAGSPHPKCKLLGSYEAWSRTLGGILEIAGVTGFLDNLNEFYEASDMEGAIWREFVEEWEKQHGSKIVTVIDLFALAEANDGFEFTGFKERAQRISFGKQLAKQRDRVIGAYRIVDCGTKSRAKQWRLVSVTPKSNSPSP